MRKDEMLKTHTKVRNWTNAKKAFFFSIDFHNETEYNAFERDIPVLNIFFSKATAIGKGTFVMINTW